MAVETKYVVVRKGEEKMTFANKKTQMHGTKCSIWPTRSPTGCSNISQRWMRPEPKRWVCCWPNRKTRCNILRTSKLPDAVKDSGETAADDSDTAAPEKEKKVRAVKAA